MVKRLFQKIENGDNISREEAVALTDEKCSLEDMIYFAGNLRKMFRGDKVYRCAIINARSGKCSEDCAYCAQSGCYKTSVSAYDYLEKEKIVSEALRLNRKGINCFGIVSSGRGISERDLEYIADIVRECVGKGVKGMGASLGILTREQLRSLKHAGLVHYNHNLESSGEFYPCICTTHKWSERYETVKNAVDEGLEVCSGGLFGMGESWMDRVSLAFSLRELNVVNIPLNFLSPIKGTPLGGRAPLGSEECLRILALFRFILPAAEIKICGGRQERLSGKGGEIFAAGASGILTGDYLTTKGSSVESDLEMILKCGLRPESNA